MLTHQGSQVLRTKRLLLRPYVQGDEEAMFSNWANDPAVCQYLTWPPHGDIAVTRELIAQWEAANMHDHCYRWGITLSGELIGDISVIRWVEANEMAELGYCLGRAWWNQGLMTEALRAVMAYLFDQVGFHRIQLKHDAMNPASGRVMHKAKLVHEGTLRDAHRRRDGSFADIHVYGALRHQWPVQREGA